jgi:hypothetical protein
LAEILGPFVTKNWRLWKKIRPLGNFKSSESVFGKKKLSGHMSKKLVKFLNFVSSLSLERKSEEK